MNIVLIGFMGTGKTSVGTLLSKELNWPLVDIDTIIEAQEGMPISEIFAKKSEPYFRDCETAAVIKAAAGDHTVISCGGGAVLRTQNMEALEKNGFVVCLHASPDVIIQRTAGNRARPLLEVADRRRQIETLLEQRKPFYARCMLPINTDQKTSREVAAAILKSPALLPKLGRLKQ